MVVWFLRKTGPDFCCNRTSGNGFKLKEGRFRLGTRKKVFTMGVVSHWYRLPRDVVVTPSLETFESSLDGALSNLISLKMSLFMLGGLDLMSFKDSSRHKLFYGSMNPAKLFQRQPNR